jgi:general secretion pathway protein E
MQTALPADRQSLANIGLFPDNMEITRFSKREAVGLHEHRLSRKDGHYGNYDHEENLKHMILKTSDANSIHQEAVECGMVPLLQDGARKVLEGVTSIEEVLRVTRVLKTRSRKRVASPPVM